MKNLEIIAGPKAKQHLLENGLKQEDISMMLGASGGPKWLALYGLDQYLFSDFFKHRTTPLQVVGSSSGAWRFATFAQPDAAQVNARFAEGYKNFHFDKKMSQAEMDASCRKLLDSVFADASACVDAVNHSFVRLNIVTARAKHLLGSDKKPFLLTGLIFTALSNFFHRYTLGWFYERVIFHQDDKSPLSHLNELPTCHVKLTEHNVRPSVLASGSIPMVVSAVNNIPGAQPGQYVDGGITDYHFDIPLPSDGLILYPHFYQHVVPGWLDKAFKWRHGPSHHFDNVIMLCPSKHWLQQQPFKKIPERKDFVSLADDERKRYWQTIMDNSSLLAEELAELVRGKRQWQDYLK